MISFEGGRAGFRQWVDSHPDPEWKLMPLTHITKGVRAVDIIEANNIDPVNDGIFEQPVAYFFYGRPAYRVSGDGAVKLEAACPFCFVFRPELIHDASVIFAFDTGAFEKRMYNRFIFEEMNAEDFSLEKDHSRINRLIACVFGCKETYLDADTTEVASPELVAKSWEHHARSYLHLIKSAGRNEPDDRICSIEVVFGKSIQIRGNVMAVSVPHTHWSERERAPWLENLQSDGVEILPYLFVPGRNPEHYQTLMEIQIREYYDREGYL